MTDAIIQKRITTGASPESIRIETSAARDRSDDSTIGRLWPAAFTGAVALIGGGETDASVHWAESVFRSDVKDREVLDDRLEALQYRMLSQNRELRQVVGAVGVELKKLSAAVALLSSRQDPVSDELSFSLPTITSRSEIDVVLDQMSDSGVFDDEGQLLAEQALESDDPFVRLAGIRFIALSNPDRGREMIDNELAAGPDKIIATTLESISRAIA